ncbi:MAG: hypothetical protein ACLFS2_11360 [Halochromatium sp.]|uniref:hypothetical protein n=1 Tax=Halochromatium sp. TaxID=2049430 RepID=UPI00397966A9
MHLSKPRLPSLLFGLLYRLLWDARLLLDCDDDELAFVGAAHARPLADWLQAHGSPPTLADLPGRRWSELAMSLAPAFDTPGAGLTVANRALQQRHGGVIVRHARDPRHDQPSGETAAARRMTAI